MLYGLAALPILQTQLNLDLSGLLATSAVLSVVIGLALQETLGNLFAGLSLQLERPYQVGDFIRIKDHTGRVVQIGWRATRILTTRRESITLPNSMVAKELVKNFSYGYEPMGIDIELGLSYEAPPNQVKAAVLDVMKEVPTLLQEPKPQCRTWAYGESSIRYQLRFWVADYSHAAAPGRSCTRGSGIGSSARTSRSPSHRTWSTCATSPRPGPSSPRSR